MASKRSSVLAQVFWPADLTHAASGFLVGWNLRSFNACIAAVVPDISLRDLESSLFHYAELASTGKLVGHAELTQELCGGPPLILGMYLKNGSPLGQPMREILSYKKAANLWLTIECGDNGIPSLKEVMCCGFRYLPPLQLIYVHRPVPGQYLSPLPFSLDANAFPDRPARYSHLKDHTHRALFQLNHAPEVMDVIHQVTQVITSEKETTPVISRRRAPSSGEGMILPPAGSLELSAEQRVLLDQLVSRYSETQSLTRSSSLPLESTTTPPTSTVDASGRSEPTSTSVGKDVIGPRTWKEMIFIHPLLLCLMALIALGRGVCYVTNLPLYHGGPRLRDISSAAQQLELRVSRLLSYPTKWRYLMHRRRADEQFARSLYIGMANSLWLFFFDIMGGVLIGLLLCYRGGVVLNVAHHIVSMVQIDALRGRVNWLMGLKPNDNLDTVLGSVALYIIETWSVFTTWLAPYEGYVVYFIAVSGLAGLSFLVALVADVVALINVHILVLHEASRLLYTIQLKVLSALWKLFRGKKYNVLRRRIDSCDYDIDQLMFGTVIFTITIFLVPTFFVYHLYFALMRLFICLVQTFALVILALVSQFPIFSLYLHLSQPLVLSSKVWYQDLGETFTCPCHTRPGESWTAKLLRSIATPPVVFSTARYPAFPQGAPTCPQPAPVTTAASDSGGRTLCMLLRVEGTSPGSLFAVSAAVIGRLVKFIASGKIIGALLKGHTMEIASFIDAIPPPPKRLHRWQLSSLSQYWEYLCRAAYASGRSKHRMGPSSSATPVDKGKQKHE